MHKNTLAAELAFAQITALFLEAHCSHVFERELVDVGPISHARLNIFPDGGVARLRLFGEPMPMR